MTAAACVEAVLRDGAYAPCNEPGWFAVLNCPAGRPQAEGGPFCEAHGGEARAIQVAEGQWNFAAPSSVGDAEAVTQAGNAHLDTTHAYIVIRPTHPGQGAVRWLASLGIGSRQIPVGKLPGSCARVNCRRCAEGRYCGRGAKAFDSPEAAVAAAFDAWRERLDTTVKAIEAMRGGTLAWGLEVAPRTTPIVLQLGPGDNAWNRATARPREGALGLAALFGIRASGEVL